MVAPPIRPPAMTCTKPPMPSSFVTPWIFAATPAVRERLSSRLVDGFSEWWQAPGLVIICALVAALVLWTYRRDAVDLPLSRRLGLMALRLGAFAALALAWLDIERTTEFEFVSPSRVAVLIDTSASMSLPEATAVEDGASGGAGVESPRAERALAVLDVGGLLDVVRQRHDVSLWAFDATAERVTLLPRGDIGAASADPAGTDDGASIDSRAGEPVAADDWRTRLAPGGDETRLGSALAGVLDAEPADLLAGVIVLSDGASNAGLEPRAAAARFKAADVAVHVLGVGAETLPVNVRVADLLAPARVFPDDRFSVTAFLQAQGLEGQRVRVELREGDEASAAVVIDARDAVLGADSDLVPVRFDVAGLPTPGRRTLAVRVVPPPTDRTPGDDRQEADIEVVDRVTRVLLMSSGPGREYQFMRNVLDRDRSFTIESLLDTASVAEGSDGVLAAFPESDAALAEYDALVAFDVDWRRLDASARERLERWVGRESGGVVLFAGSVFMDRWLADPGMRGMRGLYPVELRGLLPALDGGTRAGDTPRPVRLTRDGEAAEFLRLATDAATSETLWGSFPGVYSCFESVTAKPGATVYARLADEAGPARETQPIYLAGHYYGSGTVLYVGSGELWRLRAVDPRLHERLATQVVRHVTQGRLLRGSRTSRLLVERDRVPIGSTAQVRLVLPEGTGGRAGTVTCRVRRPDGASSTVPLDPEPGRPDVRRGGFLVGREGSWQIDVDVATPSPERLSRRIHAHLPDRELVKPRLDRALLDELAQVTGGSARFLATDGWTRDDAVNIAALLPDRSRRVYESAGADAAFKRRLNGALLALGIGMLCTEWLLRRLLKLA